jgi:hypothetical protein
MRGIETGIYSESDGGLATESGGILEILLLEEAADGGVFGEADGAGAGLVGCCGLLKFGEEVGSQGPVGLVLCHCLGWDRVKPVQGFTGSGLVGDRGDAAEAGTESGSELHERVVSADDGLRRPYLEGHQVGVGRWRPHPAGFALRGGH